SGTAANVIFSDVNSVASTVTFAVDGVYDLKLTATDGNEIRSDLVRIVVHTAPVVNAGADQVLLLSEASNVALGASEWHGGQCYFLRCE
ncbi:MAG: hypothetical protein MUF87_15755, partial [Anaerolineae bacterium]|nr:hypothetical protein [Anaerolineae bacterium]